MPAKNTTEYRRPDDPVVDIFIRSYEKDLPWLIYCLRSIHKFVTGIRQIVITFPMDQLSSIKVMNLTAEKVIGVAATEADQYLGQQITKIYADHFCENPDLILYCDSDVVYTRPFNPSELLVNGKPIWLYTPYTSLVDAHGKPVTPWQPITQKALRFAVENEYMRRHTTLIPPVALAMFRSYMRNLHGIPVEEYITNQPQRAFSEFNCLGGYCHEHLREMFYWMNTDDGVSESPVHQSWSWGGIQPHHRQWLETLLK